MSDAMVTARMSATKKEAGNRILESMGSNASQAINEFYDYLISKKQLPWAEQKKTGSKKTIDTKALGAILAEMDSMAVQLDPKFAGMTAKEAKQHRLAARGLLKEDK